MRPKFLPSKQEILPSTISSPVQYTNGSKCLRGPNVEMKGQFCDKYMMAELTIVMYMWQACDMVASKGTEEPVDMDGATLFLTHKCGGGLNP